MKAIYAFALGLGLLLVLMVPAGNAAKRPAYESQATLASGAGCSLEGEAGHPISLAWEATESGEMALVPRGETGIRRLSTKKYHQISDTHLSRLDYPRDPILGHTLMPGVVVAAHTASGFFAKLRVVSYTIDDAPLTDKEDIAKAASRGNLNGQEVRLIVEWSLYTLKGGTTILMGTWTWDIDTNILGRDKNVDVWWEHAGAEQNLQAQGDAKLAILDQEFGDVTLNSLKEFDIDRTTIPKKELKPGAVVVLKNDRREVC